MKSVLCNFINISIILDVLHYITIFFKCDSNSLPCKENLFHNYKKY